MTPRRDWAVVITGAPRTKDLAACLAAVRPQCLTADCDLIVVHDEASAPDGSIPRERHVSVPVVTGVHVRRSLGIAEALSQGTAIWVAMSETPAIPDPDWLARLSANPPAGAAVVGGAVTNARPGSLWGRALFLAEYGIYGATHEVLLPDGTPHIAAANVAYHCSVASLAGDAYARGEDEPGAHTVLRAGGADFTLRPDALVRVRLDSALIRACAERFAHGRSHARSRLRDSGMAARVRAAAGSSLALPVLTLRIRRAVHPTARPAFARTVPMLLLLLASWSLGEVTGALQRTGR